MITDYVYLYLYIHVCQLFKGKNMMYTIPFIGCFTLLDVATASVMALGYERNSAFMLGFVVAGFTWFLQCASIMHIQAMRCSIRDVSP
jgi:hypothetical protein